MEAAAWGFIGTVVGALASVGTTLLTARHSNSIRKESVQLEREEKFRVFQRDTLLELQDALHDVMRLNGKALHLDTEAHMGGAEWGKTLLPEALNEDLRVARRRLGLVVERVGDDGMRAEIKAINLKLTHSTIARSRSDADRAFNEATAQYVAAMEHLGTLLRSQY